MTSKKIQQPLLYIHQPNFEKQVIPMQQYFISKDQKRNPNVKEETSSADSNIDQHEQQTIEKLNSEVIGNPELQFNHESPSSPFQVEEIADLGIMEFILEQILDPVKKAELTEETPSKENKYISYLESIEKSKEPDKFLEIKENVVELAEEVKKEELTKPFEIKTADAISELTNLQENDLEINSFKNGVEDTRRSKKRVPFNQLSLEKKLSQLKITSLLKIKYRFITKDSVYIGYFLSLKNELIEIDSMANGIIKRKEIPLDKLVDILLFGL